MSIKEKLNSILKNQAFDELDPYKEPHSWEPMSHDERDLLASLFVAQGELHLRNGDNKVIHNFELASKLAPKNSSILFKQASAYITHGSNLKCLLEASKVLERIIEIDPQYSTAWYSWGVALIKIGILYENTSYFHLAHEKFTEAYKLLDNKAANEILASLFWEWGVCWAHIGKNSGEAADFFLSKEKFLIAENYGCNHSIFYNDFGDSLKELASLLRNKELFIEAASYYRTSTTIDPSHYAAWLNLATTYQKLYTTEQRLDYFEESDDAFQRAASLEVEDSKLWMHWGELYLTTGELKNDISQIEASLEKFEKAYNLDLNCAAVLIRWGEALLLLSAEKESLESLHLAESKIRLAVTINPKDFNTWYWYGVCLNELGRYFSSKEYYFKALEKFQQGLLFAPKNLALLHGKAMTHFSIGELTDNVAELEQSIHYYNQIHENEEEISSQILSDWGISLMKLGEITQEKLLIEAAVEKFDRAVGQYLDASEEVELECLYNYGCAMDYLGEFHEEPAYYEKAIHILSHVLELDPQQPHALYHLALAYLHQGELSSDIESLHEAVSLFQTLLQQDPEDEMGWNDCGMAFLNLAVLTNDPVQPEQSKFFFQEAETNLHQAASLGNEYAFYNLASLYALTGNTSAAIHYIERAEAGNALPPLAEIMNDEWFENLQGDPLFRQLISRLIHKNKDDLNH